MKEWNEINIHKKEQKGLHENGEGKHFLLRSR